MNSRELANAIIHRSNEFAIVSKLHSANVAYLPKCMIDGYLDTGEWKMLSPNVFLLNSDITVYVKQHLNIICVSYMKVPEDEMPQSDLVETVDMNLILEYREALKWKANKK